ALLAEVAATESRKLKGPGLGLGTSFQLRPFQRSIRVLSLVAVAYVPTAHALLAEVAATALRPVSLTRPAGFGLGTRAHFVPFQCSIRVFGPLLAEKLPTAQALLAEVAATPASTLLLPGAGAAFCTHRAPSQCRTSGMAPVPPENWPTAQASVAETASTPLRSLKSLPGLGPAACVHIVPAQCPTPG